MPGLSYQPRFFTQILNSKQTVKALSILQPWASLIVTGHKRIETRSWKTDYRGTILIHASKSFTSLNRQPPSFLERVNEYLNYQTLPTGAIIGSATLQNIYSTEILGTTPKWITEEGNRWELSVKEIYLGDFAPFRYMWLLKNIKRFAKPIPCKGSLSLWDVSPEIIAQLPKL